MDERLAIIVEVLTESEGEITAKINEKLKRVQSKIDGIKLKIDDKSLQKIQEGFKTLNKATEDSVNKMKTFNAQNAISKKQIDNNGRSLSGLSRTYKQLGDGQKKLTETQRTITTQMGTKVKVIRQLDESTGKLDKVTLRYTRNLDQLRAQQEKNRKAADELKEKLGQQIAVNKDFNTSTDKGKEALRNWVQETKGTDASITKMENSTKIAGKTMSTFSVTTKDAAGNNIIFNYALNKTTGQIHQLGERLKPVINRQLSFIQQMGIAIQRSIQWGLAMGVLYGSLRKVREGMTFIAELDKDLTQVSVITGQTREQTRELARSYATLGLEMGKTVKEISQVNTELIRQGLSIDETGDRLKVITQLSSAANMEISESLRFITSAVNALGVEAERAADVALRASQITASSVPEVAEAFTKTASSAKATGVELTELGAIISGLVEITQESPSSLGNSMKTLLARFNQVNEETGELNEEINRVGAAFSSAGVKFTDAEGQVRPFYELVSDLSLVWDDLDKNTKLYISTMAAGVRQQNRFLAIMENFGRIQEINNELMYSSGTLMQSYDTYLGSVEASANRAQAAFEQMFINAMNSDAIKYFYEFTTTLTIAIDQIGGFRFAIASLVTILALSNKTFAQAITWTGLKTKAMALLTKATTQYNLSLAAQTQGMVLNASVAMKLKAALSVLNTGIWQTTVAMARLVFPIIAISLFIEWIVRLIGKNNELNNSFDETGQVLRQTAEQYNRMDSVIKQMEKLDAAAKNNTEAQEELNQLQREVAGAFPELIDGYDEEGRAIATNTEKIKERNEALGKELTTNSSERIAIFQSEEKELDKLIEKEQERLDRARAAIKEIEDNNGKMYVEDEKGRGFWVDATSLIDEHNAVIKESIINLDDYATKQTDVNSKLQIMKNNIDRAKVEQLALNFVMAESEKQGETYNILKEYAIQFGWSIEDVIALINEQAKVQTDLENGVPVFNDLQSAQEHVATTLSELQENTQDARDALNEYAESGEFSMDTILQLANNGIPELISALGDEEQMHKIIENAVLEKENTYISTLDIMVEQTKKAIDSMIDIYGVDLAAFGSTQLAKAAMLDDRSQKLNKARSIGEAIGAEQEYADIFSQFDILEALEKAQADLNDISAGLNKPSDSKKDKKIETGEILKDRYHNLNIEIQKTNNLLDENKQAMTLADDTEKIRLLQQQNELYQIQQQNIGNLIEAKHEEKAELQSFLQSHGFIFDATTGQLQNYESQLDKINQIYKTQPDEIDKIEDALNNLTDLRFSEIPGLNDQLREMSIIMQQNSQSAEDMTRTLIRNIIQTEQKYEQLQLEMKSRSAQKQIEGIQRVIQGYQDEIAAIQDAEKARKEKEERTSHIAGIQEIQNKLYHLQKGGLEDITDEQAKALGIEEEVSKAKEHQINLIKLQERLENLRRQKTIQELTKREDGIFEYQYVVDQAEIDKVVEEIENEEQSFQDWRLSSTEQLLQELQTRQKAFDDWNRTNDINQKIEQKNRLIQAKQEEITIINEKLNEQRERLADYYMDIDRLTEHELARQKDLHGENWELIAEELGTTYDGIQSKFNSFIDSIIAAAAKLQEQKLTIQPKESSGSSSGSKPSTTSGGKGTLQADGTYAYAVTRTDGSKDVAYVGSDGRTERTASGKDLNKGDVVHGSEDWVKKHEGGIVGRSTRDLSQTVNKLFNTKPNEQMVKALKGELFIPEKNIVGNFVPNMQNLVGSLMKDKSGGTVNQYHISKLEFPNVQSGQEIVDAINNLDGAVQQYKGRYRLNG